ncbi:MAG: putative DNA-binding domain-containing protein [Oligoflexus sp.]
MSLSSDEKKLVQKFARSIIDPQIPLNSEQIRHPERMSLHRHHHQQVLSNTLRNRFPKLAGRLQAVAFSQLCRQFQEIYPCREPVLEHYGHRLPEFLAKRRGQDDGLANLASLEKQIHTLQQQQEPLAALSLEQIRTIIDKGQILQLKLFLNPSLIIISSRGNLWDFWHEDEALWQLSPQDLGLWLGGGELKIQQFPNIVAHSIQEIIQQGLAIDLLWEQIATSYGMEALQDWMRKGLESFWLQADWNC